MSSASHSNLPTNKNKYYSEKLLVFEMQMNPELQVTLATSNDRPFHKMNGHRWMEKLSIGNVTARVTILGYGLKMTKNYPLVALESLAIG